MRTSQHKKQPFPPYLKSPFCGLHPYDILFLFSSFSNYDPNFCNHFPTFKKNVKSSKWAFLDLSLAISLRTAELLSQ